MCQTMKSKEIEKRQEQEKYLEKRLKEEVQKMGGLCVKLHSSIDAGMPDRLVLIRGKAIFVELKSTGKKLSPLQALYAARLAQVGHQVHVVDSLDTLREVINLCQV